jgi:CspA family cold shock protein
MFPGQEKILEKNIGIALVHVVLFNEIDFTNQRNMTFIEKIKRGLLRIESSLGAKRIKNIGKVKFLNRTKGYGFIKSNEIEKDVFMHFSDAEDYINAGDEVKFFVEKESRGLRAVQIELA